MPIHPLPQFETDLAEYLREKEDRDAYERLSAPTSIVARFGAMKMVGEFPYDGDAKPGCGSKLVLRTHRGEELGEMLTSTCPNAGCSKSVTRREMLEYIENSGGKDYPFFDAKQNKQGVKGRVLRIATKEDLDRQAAIEAARRARITRGRELARSAGFGAKVVDVEPILGGGYVCYYYHVDEGPDKGGPRGRGAYGRERGGGSGEQPRRVDHGPFLSTLKEVHTGERVEVRQVGARDEARLTADYERCGQHCCCKNFLKVLKPVSMRSAKVQKATLDPLKISGRCGRLMCCLRYEDATYKELKQNLPHRKTRWGTPHGDGIVIDSQILTQLVLIELDTRERVAVPVEELSPPESATAPAQPQPRARPAKPDRASRAGHNTARGGGTDDAAGASAPDGGPGVKPVPKRKPRGKSERPAAEPGTPPAAPKAKVGGRRRKPKKPAAGEAGTPAEPKRPNPKKPDAEQAGDRPKKRRRRRRSLGGPSENPSGGGSGDSTPDA